MSISSTKRRLKETRGSNTIEFAVLALVMFGTTLGLIDLCRFMFVYTTLANAARAGARYAIVHGADRTGFGVDGPSSANDYTQVANVVDNYFHLIDFRTRKNLALGCGARRRGPRPCVQVDYLDGPNTVGSRVRVSVQYPYNPLFLANNPNDLTVASNLSFTLASSSEGVIAF